MVAANFWTMFNRFSGLVEEFAAMSLFKKVLASIGIGSAKLETVVQNAELYPGQELRGFVVMQGGEVEQTINAVHLELRTHYLVESGEHSSARELVLEHGGIFDPFVLRPKEVREFPFGMPIPLDCPASLHKSRVWLETRLDLPNATDPTDRDNLQVLPLPSVGTVVQAMELLGFELVEVQCEQNRRFSRDRPFVQDYEFRVRGGPFRGRLDEVEVYFFPEFGSLSLVLQIDRRSRGLSGMLDEHLGTDERYRSLLLAPEQLAHGPHGVAGLLERTLFEAAG